MATRKKKTSQKAQEPSAIRALVERLVAAARESAVDGVEGPGQDAWEHYKYWVQEDYAPGYYPYAVEFFELAEKIVADLDRESLVTAWGETPAGRWQRRKNSEMPGDVVVLDRVVRELMRRFASRASRDPVTDEPWRTRFGLMGGPDFPIFVKLLKRPRRGLVEVQGYSVATGPDGERGQVYESDIVMDMTESDFEAARAKGWRLPWSE